MPAPEIAAFGDADHDTGETGLTVDGGGFGAFPGSAWIFENADRSGLSDQLTIGAWNDIRLTGVDLPAVPNTPAGARFLFVQREDLAWSQAFPFTFGNVVAAVIPPALQHLVRGFSGHVVAQLGGHLQ